MPSNQFKNNLRKFFDLFLALALSIFGLLAIWVLLLVDQYTQVQNADLGLAWLLIFFAGLAIAVLFVLLAGLRCVLKRNPRKYWGALSAVFLLAAIYYLIIRDSALSSWLSVGSILTVSALFMSIVNFVLSWTVAKQIGASKPGGDRTNAGSGTENR